MKNIAFAILLSCLAPLALHAQAAHLVKDINSTRNAGPSSSSPDGFIRFGSRVFFAAETIAAGRELWATDGTQAGTTQIADLRVGPGDSNPSQFAVVNDKLIFNARDSRGEELWMSDGTVAGTRLMADIGPSSSSSVPGDRIVFGGKMLFTADEPVNGRELWVTDGTPAGTRLFKDLRPGSDGSEPRSFVLMNGLVYFVAANALWKTDGTAAGTVIVKDGVSTAVLTVAGSRLFFNGYTDATGHEPWVSDGTEAGTRMIVEITAGPRDSIYYSMTAFGDRVLFPADDSVHGSELWISDGTAAGTRMVRDVAPGTDDASAYLSVAVLGETAVFACGTPLTGMELWKTDGTEAGTMLLRDIVPDAGGFLAGLTTVGNRIFFISRSGANGLVWADGTAAGTQPIGTAQPQLEVVMGGVTLFTFVDGTAWFAGANPLNGYEPWKSDGTDAGTSMIANIAVDPAPSSNPGNLKAAGDWLYFDAWDGMEHVGPNGGDPRSIWRTDGRPEGTVELTDQQPYLADAVAVGRSMFLMQGNMLWISDGTPAGTKPATEFVSRFPSGARIHSVHGDTIIVGAAEQLWATKLAPGSSVVSLGAGTGTRYFDFAGRLFYLAEKEYGSGFSLRTTDGTPAGTYTVAPDFAGFPFGRKPVVMGGHVYFVTQGDDATKLWKSDGTFQGTVMVKALPAEPSSLVAASRRLFFTTSDEQLWVTDGTEAGTHALPAKPAYGIVAAVGDRVVFNASDAASGSELWVSDGTVEGTRLLRDIFPGASDSSPGELTSIAGVVYLSADDGIHGYEVWVSDGTAAGTRLAADVQPGTMYSAPRPYVRAGEQVFFTALTEATGYELWALPLSPALRLTIGDVRVEESSSSGMARFTVRLSSASAQSVTVEYTTSDSTATAGSDYDAASGTITFAAGETAKEIAVPVRADAVIEGNESFFVTLRNPAGAVLETVSAFGMIEDDDVTADVAVTPDFSFRSGSSIFADVANHGPGTATNLRGFATATPASVSSSTCSSCPRLPSELESGESQRSFEYRWADQQYVTYTATAREHDPATANNRTGWTSNNYMAMDALYLTPGQEANIWMANFGSPSAFSIESSNPAVLSVPAGITLPAASTAASFVARGLSPGTATVRVFTPAGTFGTLQVGVVAAGTTPRWPGALNIFREGHIARFDEEVHFRIYRAGTAPFTGQIATGVVIIKANGREVGRVALPAVTPAQGLKVPYRFADIGLNTITAEYGGDENFLPETSTWPVTATLGAVTITGSAERTGASARVRLQVEGSPMATPTGTISIHEPGVIPMTQATLTATATAGIAQADLTVPNVIAGSHTLVITYEGDTHYTQSTQNLRITDERRRAVRH